MKRKFLSILLTLAMALTLLPTAAMAEGASYDCEGGTDCHHKVAKINDDPRYDDVVAHFDTLEEAMRRWLRLLRQLQMAALSCCWLM